MTSLLEGKFKAQVAKAFKGKLTKGILRRTDSTTVDSWGDTVPGTVTDVTFEGIRQDFTARYKAQAGIPDTDVILLILLGSMSNVTITPRQDDLVFMKAPWNKWYRCRRVMEIDPAGASCKLQAYEIPAP